MADLTYDDLSAGSSRNSEVATAIAANTRKMSEVIETIKANTEKVIELISKLGVLQAHVSRLDVDVSSQSDVVGALTSMMSQMVGLQERGLAASLQMFQHMEKESTPALKRLSMALERGDV